MPSRQLIDRQSYPGTNVTVLKTDLQMTWQRSPRVNGKLVLKSNPATRRHWRQVTHQPFGPTGLALGAMTNTYVQPTALLTKVQQHLEAETYARLRGRLYKGSASLGVTIGSYKQSRQMIVSRYRQMTLQADMFEKRARRLLVIGKSHNQRRLHAINMRNLGSQYLEMVFGWKPLLSDIHAALTTVIDTKPAVRWVRASARTHVDWLTINEVSATRVSTRRYNGEVRRSRGVKVTVSNPNLWLRERAGLNNPAAVAWDLVPWSFVVNMFVNTGALVNSITDFAGLSFTDPFDVQASRLVQSSQVAITSGSTPYGGSSVFTANDKSQTKQGLTRPPLVFRIPDASWETAAIAASLFLQRFRRLEVLRLGFK